MSIPIGIVFLGKGAKVSLAAFQKDFSLVWPTTPKLGPPQKHEDFITMSIGEAEVAISLVSEPFPYDMSVKASCEASLLWENASQEVQAHRSHIRVVVTKEPNVVKQHQLLTQVIASLLATIEQAIGVFWMNAVLVIPKALFREVATDLLPNENPVLLWVNFRVAPLPSGGWQGLTQGLPFLGLMDIVINSSPDRPIELRNLMMGVVTYQLKNGTVIKDGEIVGESAVGKNIQVKYAKSNFGHADPVMQLDSIAKKKSWWSRG